MIQNYYKILGISMKATDAEIKAAYKKMAMLYHPDRNQGSRFHEEQFKLVLEAYQILSDKQKRNQYDLKLFYSVYSSSHSAPTNRQRQSAPQNAAKTTTSKPRSNHAYKKNTRKPSDGVSLASRLVFASTFIILSIIVGYYINKVMNRYTAEDYLKKGNYEIALKFDNTFAEAYYMRAEAHKNSFGNYDAAISDYSKAIEHADEASSDMFYQRAMCYLKVKKYQEALEDFEKTVNLQPGNDSAWYAIGDINTYIYENFTNGLKSFDKVTTINPKHYDAYFGKGYCYLNLKKYENAVDNFNTALKLNNLKSDLFYYRGFAYLGIGDSTIACRNWDEALTMGKLEAVESMRIYCIQNNKQENHSSY